MNSQRQWRAARDRPRTPVQLEDLHANAALRGILIESRIPGNGRLRFIEVKGRASGAATLTVARNEILCSLNRPEDYILGIDELLDGGEHRLRYVREPFQREPDFGATSVNYDFAQLLARAEAPG